MKVVRESIQSFYASRLTAQSLSVDDDDSQWLYLRSFLPEGAVRVLDAGCGAGRYATNLAEHGYQVHAIDLFNNIPVKNFRYTQASVDRLPYADRSFDFAYSLSVLFYLDDPMQGLLELNRVLRPGSLLLISAHTKYSAFTAWRILKRAVRPETMRHLEGVSFHSSSQYAQWLREAGFDVLVVDGYGVWGPIPNLYRKIRRLTNKLTGAALPLPRRAITRNRAWAKLSSVLGYHSILVARKA